MLVRAAVRLSDGGLCRLPTMRTEKVDRGDLVQAFAQAAHIRRRDILALTQRARLACQLLIVGVTRSVEHSAQLRIAHAADKARFEDQRLAAIFGDLAMQFFEQRARVLAIGERMDGVLERRGPDRLQTPPDLHPQIRSEEHTSELQSLMRNSYAVFCLKKKKRENQKHQK